MVEIKTYRYHVALKRLKGLFHEIFSLILPTFLQTFEDFGNKVKSLRLKVLCTNGHAQNVGSLCMITL